MKGSFISAEQVAQHISAQGFDQSVKGIVQHMKRDYARWDDFEKCARYASYVPKGVIELMPIYDDKHYACKWVNGHPENTQEGLLSILALGILCDVRTGYPLVLCDMTLLTALRTACMSAWVAQLIGRSDSVIGMIGCGAQAMFHAAAFQALMPLKKIIAYDLDASALARFQKQAETLGITVVAAKDISSMLAETTCVITLTASRQSQVLFPEDALQPGTFICAVGGDAPGKTELDPAIIQNASIIVEYPPQTKVEGEWQQCPDKKVTQVCDLVHRQDLLKDASIIVFDSVGFALSDFSTLMWLYETASTSFKAPEVQHNDLWHWMISSGA